jgi:hypothetical protein
MDYEYLIIFAIKMEIKERKFFHVSFTNRFAQYLALQIKKYIDDLPLHLSYFAA